MAAVKGLPAPRRIPPALVNASLYGDLLGDQGIGRFLIAEGSGYSLPVGRALLTGLRAAQRKGRRIR